MNYLSSNLRLLRKQKRISQEEFAAQVGLNRGNIASYEKGIAEPRIENLVRIAQYFHVPVADLVNTDLGSAPSQALSLEAEGAEPGANQSPPKPEIRQAEIDMLGHFEQRADELDTILNGFNTYHRFKVQSLDTLPKELQMMVINFEELFEVTEVLMKAHRELLGKWKQKLGDRD